jgi:tRNA-dihydrouridine synthase A
MKKYKWKVSVAPMMDWTDRHCRHFHRLITKNTLLYTEMVTTNALLHANPAKFLSATENEHPVALQLGGSERGDLAKCALLGAQWGYDQINLNCGCPSPRVQRGSFGACLMRETTLVSDCIKAMRDAVDIPVTVKHRIGIDKQESYDFVRDFVGQVSESGCDTFIVHARNAWLDGLSPKENRRIPPLRYDFTYRLKKDFPNLFIVINGGIKTNAEIQAHLQHVDGVMVGREAYHNPWLMADWDELFFNGATQIQKRSDIEKKIVSYMQEKMKQEQTPWSTMARHMLGLYSGQTGARRWRQLWSDSKLKTHDAVDVWHRAQLIHPAS